MLFFRFFFFFVVSFFAWFFQWRGAGVQAWMWEKAQVYIEESCRGDLSSVANVYLRFWVCLCCDTGEVAGMVGLQDLGQGVAELRRMHLKREFRGFGLGSVLVECLLRFARNCAGIRRVELSTPEHNSRSILFYKQCGFLDSGRRQATHGIEEEQMVFLFMDLALSRDVVLFADSIALHKFEKWFEPFLKLVYVGAFNGEIDGFFDVFASQKHLRLPAERFVAKSSSRMEAKRVFEDAEKLVFLSGGSCEEG